MKITCVASTFTHEIRYFEFLRPDDGRLITAFYQVVQKPDTGIGCFDDCEEAIELINNLPVLEDTKNVIPLLQLKIPTRRDDWKNLVPPLHQSMQLYEQLIGK